MPGQDSMVSICTRLKRCLKLWSQEPERDEEKPYFLVTKDPSNRSFVGPTSPCQWMVHTPGATMKRPGGPAIYVASIRNILDTFKKDPDTVHLKKKQDRNIYIFKIGKPDKRPVFCFRWL